MDRQIIAIGGGGFGREINELKIENYIIEQSNIDSPSICFIPTATGDEKDYIETFYKAFDYLGCKTSHIDFFKRTIKLEEHISEQDIIYVGGGNTKSMLAVWREWKLDEILHKAYINGTIMSGVSAKQANQANKDENEIDDNNEESNADKSLSNELEKLNALRESGVLTQEEFEKAKNKLLNN